ncbi:unnamed protein product, partial [Tetraodon nigroviridis]
MAGWWKERNVLRCVGSVFCLQDPDTSKQIPNKVGSGNGPSERPTEKGERFRVCVAPECLSALADSSEIIPQTRPVPVRGRGMAQPRVTDYFTRRRRSVAADAKPAARHGRLRSSSFANKDLRLSPVREDFVRVIDAAVSRDAAAVPGSRHAEAGGSNLGEDRLGGRPGQPSKLRGAGVPALPQPGPGALPRPLAALPPQGAGGDVPEHGDGGGHAAQPLRDRHLRQDKAGRSGHDAQVGRAAASGASAAAARPGSQLCLPHRRFEEGHVAQIKAVFPEAYTFRRERNVPPFSSSSPKGSFQLTVEPSLTPVGSSHAPPDQKESRPLLSASRLLERRRTFNLNLVSIVKQHHAAFLASLVPPMSVPEDRLTRWHPRFNVDTVPAVEPSQLPQPPPTERLSTAQEVLEKARSLITPKMEKALESLALAAEGARELKEAAPPAAPAAPADQVPDGLKGVSKSLVDRIRAKEAQKMQAAMTRNPGRAERLLMMSRLPELARILRNVFVEEKKPALVMEVACNRMVTSYRSALSPGDMEKHVRLLAEVAADWLSIHPVRKDFYLKLNRKMELRGVVDRLSSRLEEEQQ